MLAIHREFGRASIAPSAVTYQIDARRAESPVISLPSVPEVLRKVAVFRPLSDDEIRRLAEALWPEEHGVGECLVEQGDSGTSMFVIATGIVALSRRIDGAVKEIERLSTGQCFGEMSMLTGEPRYSTAKALTNVRLIEIPKARFEPILAGNERLHESLAQIAAARRAHSEALQESLSEHPSRKLPSAEVEWFRHMIQRWFAHRS